MDILHMKQKFNAKLEESKNMTEEELFEHNMGYIKVLQKAPFGESLVCHMCKHYFNSVVGKDKESGVMMVEYMHKMCGNPCKKKMFYDSDKKIAKKVE